MPARKSKRVANYHWETMESVSEIIGAAGIPTPSELRPWHIVRRTTPNEIKNYAEIYTYLQEGDLMREPLPPAYARACRAAVAHTFSHG